MKLSTINILLSVALAVIFAGCTVSKKGTDRSVTRYVRKNAALIQEAAQFAIIATLNTPDKTFAAEDVHDKAMRKKISSLGSIVEVNYRNASGEIPDSNVTFKSITLFGVTEIVYDFAAGERSFEEKTSNPKNYYFIRLHDRIYYRRRPFPMM